MSRLLDIVFVVIVTFLLYVIYATVIYINKVYKKAMQAYNCKRKARAKYYSVQKQKITRSIVETDIRRPIDIRSINKLVGYAMFTFEGERVKTNSRLQNYDRLNSSIKSIEKCLFIKVGDRFVICNLSQSNEVFLNGIKVNNTKEIKYGDYVEIGEISFQFNNILGVA